MEEIPYVKVTPVGAGFEGVVALALESIVSATLHAEKPEILQAARESFLKALLPWPSTVSLEIRIASLPNIACKPQGICWVTLLIRAVAPTAAEARKSVLQVYLDLKPILPAYYAEAEFGPVTEMGEMEARTQPFEVRHAMSVRRRSEKLALSSPLKKMGRVGFGDVQAGGHEPEPENEVDHTSPWIPSLDDWSRIIDVLSGLMDPVMLLIRIRPADGEVDFVDGLMEVVERCETFLGGVHANHLTFRSQVEAIRNVALARAMGLRDGGFDVGVFILSPAPIASAVGQIVGLSVTSEDHLGDGINPFVGHFVVEQEDTAKVLRADHFPESEPFAASEAACAFRLPSPPDQMTTGLPVRTSRTAPVRMPARHDEAKSDAIRLFVNEHKGTRVPILSTVEDRMRHCFIVGQTGTGKSTLLQKMVISDIHAGRGVAVIDPHGDLVNDILEAMPKERAEDLIYFDFLDRERPLGFNPITFSTIEERDLLVDEIYQTIDRIYDMSATGGPIFETHFRSMMKILMGDGSKVRGDFVPTLLDFVRCYTDVSFQSWLIKTIDDPQAADFLREANAAGGDAKIQNVAPYITSKFSRFVNDKTLQRIIGQPKNSFDFDDIMNQGKIFLVRLGKGRFGAPVAALLTNLLVSRFKLAAMKRGAMAPEDRRDFFLYVDEAHNLPGDNFAELLSEARKYRMSLTLATQYCAQLAGGTPKSDLLSAVIGNVGTTVAFRLGATDAEAMAPVFYPHFTPLDIIGLPNFHGYARMLSDQETTPPFSFRGDRHDFPRSQKLAMHLTAGSRLKFGEDATVLDAESASRRKQLEAMMKGK